MRRDTPFRRMIHGLSAVASRVCVSFNLNPKTKYGNNKSVLPRPKIFLILHKHTTGIPCCVKPYIIVIIAEPGPHHYSWQWGGTSHKSSLMSWRSLNGFADRSSGL